MVTTFYRETVEIKKKFKQGSQAMLLLFGVNNDILILDKSYTFLNFKYFLLGVLNKGEFKKALQMHETCRRKIVCFYFIQVYTSDVFVIHYNAFTWSSGLPTCS